MKEKVTRQEKLDHGNRILLDKNLSPVARLIGWYIADHINRKRGYAWCPQEYIAKNLGISERHVRRSVHDLARYFNINRSHRQHEYRLPTPDMMSCITPDTTPDILSLIPDILCTDTGHDVRPSFEHPLKHPLNTSTDVDGAKAKFKRRSKKEKATDKNRKRPTAPLAGFGKAIREK